MIRKMLLIAFLSAVLLTPFCVCSQNTSTGGNDSSVDILNFKMDYEKKLRDTLQEILDRTVGAGKSYVTVSVDVTADIEKRQKTTYTKPADEELDSWLSPGVPLPPGLKGANPKNSEDYQTVTKPKIASVAVTAILDSGLSEELDAEVKDTIEKAVGLPKTQMKVEIKRQAFSAQSNKFFEANKVYLIYALIVLAAIAFLFGPVRSFMSSIVRTMAESKGRNVNIDMGGKEGAGGNPLAPSAPTMMGAPGMMAGGAAGALTAGGAISGESVTKVSDGQTITLEKGGEVRVFRPFSFIKKSNIPNLAYLLQEEPPEIVSLIMTYLSQEEAAEVMGSMPIESQAKIAIAMAQVKQANAESVLKAEEDIKKKIDFLVGGIDRFIGILDKVDKSTREEILEALEKESPVLADRVRKEIFTFENILDMDDNAFQLILREVKTDSLARALNKASEAMIEKVKKNISSGAATLLQEEMNLAGYLTPMQVDEERNKIVGIVKKLEREGKVSIGSGKRRKADKIDKIETIGEAMKASGSDGGETAVGSKGGSAYTERKVGMKDYDGKASARSISMAGLYKDNNQGGSPETAQGSRPDASPAQKEGFFASRKPAGAAQATAQAAAGAAKPGTDPKAEMTRAYGAGQQYYKEKKFDDAIRELTQVTKINPNLWQVHQLIGNCYFAKGNMVETVRAYQKSLSLNPNNPTLANWLKQYNAKNAAAR